MRRHRVGVAVAASLLALLVAFAATTGIQARRIARERDRANREAETAKAVNDFLQDDLLAQAGASAQARPDTKPDPDLKVRTALDRAAAGIEGKFGAQPLVEASIRSDDRQDLRRPWVVSGSGAAPGTSAGPAASGARGRGPELPRPA